MKRVTFRSWVNIGLAALLIGVGVGATQAVASEESTTSTTRTVTVEKGTILSTVSATGNVEAANSYTLNFDTSGEITEILVKEGDVVSEGQELAKLDNTTQQANLEVAKLELSAAEQKLEEAESGVTASESLKHEQSLEEAQAKVTSAQKQLDSANAKGDADAIEEAEESLASAKTSLSYTKREIALEEDPDDSEIASARSTLINAQAALEEAQEDLDATVLRAPSAGTLTELNLEVGDDVSGTGSSSSSSSTSSSTTGSSTTGSSTSSSSSSSSSDFGTLIDLTALQVKAGFTESDITKLKVGQTVNLTYDALTDEANTGTIVSIDPSSTTVSNVVTYYVYITINSPSTSVKPGMTATAQVVIDSRDNVLYVTSSAVSGGNGESKTGTVQLVQDGQEITTTVTIGLKGDDSTEIVSGLNEGDQVAITTTTSSSSSSTANLGSAGALTGSGGGFGGAPPGGM